MSLILEDVYNATKNKYHLTCITGNNNMNKIMNWVYVSEDFNTSNFLQGGELVITTGVCLENNNNWLYEFIKHMIQQNTCGIILNTGKYIHKEDITKEIIKLCEKHNFTLFTMPWNIHIYDISRDYYNRIFLDNQTDLTISQAFSSIIHKDTDYDKSISTLSDYGFSYNDTYYICSIISDFTEKLTYNLRHIIYKYNVKCHIISNTSYFHLIFCNETLDTVNNIIENISYYKHIGISEICTNISKLNICCEQSIFSSIMAIYNKTHIYNYKNAGVFKILFAVNDKNVLRDYTNEQLNNILEFDKQHNSDYTETLRQFLLHNGSLKAISTSMNCHRNTVNYRLNVIRHTLNYDLDNQQTRFNLMTAYTIIEFLKILATDTPNLNT